jgi:hypothetical protein
MERLPSWGFKVIRMVTKNSLSSSSLTFKGTLPTHTCTGFNSISINCCFKCSGMAVFCQILLTFFINSKRYFNHKLKIGIKDALFVWWNKDFSTNKTYLFSNYILDCDFYKYLSFFFRIISSSDISRSESSSLLASSFFFFFLSLFIFF